MHSHSQAVIPGGMVAHEHCVSFPVSCASMGKTWKKELCSQPGRVAAEPQHTNVSPVSCEFPLSLAKASARTLHLEDKKPCLPFTCTPGV